MPPVVYFPFHQDERLGADTIPVDAFHTTVVAPALPEGDQWQRLLVLYDAMAEAVTASVREDGLTTVVTGDCLALLGTLAGAQRAGQDPSLVWFDAHGDVHTLASSASGYLGGLSLRMALGGDADRLGDPLGLRPVPEDRAFLVGARDLDPPEAAFLEASRVHRSTVEDLRPDHLPDGPVIVHLDADVIDESEVPGLRFPVPHGPSRATVAAAVHRLLDSGRVGVLDIACPWYAPADPAETRSRADLLTDLLRP